MRRTGAALLLLSILAVQSACGGSSPAAPSTSPNATPSPTPAPPPTPTAPAAVSGLQVTQVAALGGSEFQLSWSGSAPTYAIKVRAPTGGTDLTDVTSTSASFSWKAPSAGQFVATVLARNDVGDSPTTDVTLVSVDLRDVIDAMVFSSGPLSDVVQFPSDSARFVGWPDGIQLRVLFAPAVGTRGRDIVETFTSRYAAITNGAVTAVMSAADTDMKSWVVASVPIDSIAVRVMTLSEMQQAGICTASNTYGGCNSGAASSRRGLTTLHEPDAVYAGHEIGHAYGMFHINLPPGTRLRRGLMAGGRDAGLGPAYGELSDTEVRAIQAMHAARVRAGATRGQMKTAGLIN